MNSSNTIYLRLQDRASKNNIKFISTQSDKLYITKLMYMKTIKIIVDNNDLSIKKHISMAQYKNTT